jgi:3-oxoacyl-[acyl-carrier protein] reductase
MDDALRLFVQDRRAHVADVLGAKVAREGQRSSRVGDVVDDEQTFGSKQREVRDRRQEQRLVKPLINTCVELDVQRRHVLDSERVGERAARGQAAPRQGKHRVGCETGRVDLPGQFLNGGADVVPRHPLPLHKRENFIPYKRMETGLAGKRVLVTGASGGIGGACARAFASEGAEVVAHYHRGRERGEALGDVTLVGADLTREDEVERLFAQVGPLDVCAAVAGVWPSEDVPVWELPLDRWRATLDANLTASFLTARGFLRQLEGDGALVLVGSTAGIFGEAGHADYAAAKSAILGGLLLSLKNEVVRKAPHARVNAVAPGWTESPMTRGHVSEEQIQRVSRTMALRKVAQPEDVAHQVVLLASPLLSGHVTGQVVTVAGGMEGRVVHD